MKDITLFNKERQQKILELIYKNGSVNVANLADFFNVTPATIRTDLTYLESQGELTRTHGGAIANIPNRREPKINERYNEDEKNRIAEKAVEFIEEDDIILLDTGTTMASLAKALVASKLTKLTVFSNDIDVIRVLEEKEEFSLHIIPGKMRNGFHYSFGPQVTGLLKDCHFNKLFISTSAISIDHGLTTQNPDLAQIKRDMIKTADKVFLLVDSSKMHHVDFQKFADLNQIDMLFMDSKLTKEDRNLLENSVKKMILV